MRNGAAPPLCEARSHATTRSSGRIRFLRFCVEQYEHGGSVKAGNNPGRASTSSEAVICAGSPRQSTSRTMMRRVFMQATCVGETWLVCKHVLHQSQNQNGAT